MDLAWDIYMLILSEWGQYTRGAGWSVDDRSDTGTCPGADDQVCPTVYSQNNSW